MKKISLLYKSIYLQNIELDKDYTVEEIKKELSTLFCFNYTISIKNIENNSKIFCLNVDDSDVLQNEMFNKKMNDELNENNKKIIKYLDVLESLSNSSFTDIVVCKNNRAYPISYVSIIAERNYEIFKTLLVSYINEKNMIICYFLLRDLIENVKLYLYLLNEDRIEENEMLKKVNIIENANYNSSNKIKKFFVNGKTWEFNAKSILHNIDSLKEWEYEIKRAEQINKICNNYIHKNGLEKVLTKFAKKSYKIIGLEDFFFVIKLFFTLIVCYDGKELSAYDYISYIEEGEKPPENSQYWIAKIYEDFIKSEYSLEEIRKMKNLSYMLI